MHRVGKTKIFILYNLYEIPKWLHGFEQCGCVELVLLQEYLVAMELVNIYI